ncbi:MAG: response regulator [Polyangiales bacterium]
MRPRLFNMRDNFPEKRVRPSPVALTTPFEEESGERVALGRLGNILIVEADPDEQWLLARRLTDAGARVVGTSSGEGALALVSEWTVDAVLIADELPGMDGFEVCRRMVEGRPNVQVLIMANDPAESVVASARRAGARGCIPRPVDLASLSVRLADSAYREEELLALAP